MNPQDLIYLGIAVISAVVAVIMFVRKPQEAGEVKDAVFEVRFKSIEDLVINLRDNHIHSIECKLDSHSERLTRIETKLEDILKK